MFAHVASVCTLAALLAAPPSPYFRIQVVDSQSGRGVPLVELETVNHVRYHTDNNGLVAFDEPGLMDQEVYFQVKSHGYEYPKDGFGFRCARLQTKAGGSATLKIDRVNIAERLYRVTGQGLYRDTVLLGEAPPLREPLLNGQVVGQDSTLTVLFNNKIHWFWGDTCRPKYPLGNFHCSMATSELPKNGGLDPLVGIDLTYFKDENGFAAEMCKMPGEGPTWIDAIVVFGDKPQRMLAQYVKVRKELEVYEQGFVEFNNERQRFEHHSTFEGKPRVGPGGHPIRHRVDQQEYWYFSKPLPYVRVKATPEAYLDLTQYEAFTCLAANPRSPEKPTVDRDSAGKLRFAWRKDGLEWTTEIEEQLVKDKRIREDEAPTRLIDVDGGKAVQLHRTSIEWNEYRKAWVMIACQVWGTSMLGEIWYAESPTLEGPWKHAKKIVTHDQYSFYNPKQHALLAQQGGQVLLFEGTYTAAFSGNPVPTPRYDYNQIMYKLDLAEPRLSRPAMTPKR